MTKSDYINLFAVIFSGISTVFAGISILVGISAYRKAKEDEYFANFRKALLGIRENHRAINRMISEAYICDIARRIVDHLKRILPEVKTPAEFAAYLKNPANHNYVASAIHLGSLEAPVKQEVQRSVTLLEMHPYQFRERFPLMFNFSRLMNTYTIQFGKGVFAAKVFDKTIGNHEFVAKTLEPNLLKLSTLQEAFSETELFISSGPTTMVEGAQKVYDEAYALLTLILDHYLKTSDSHLQEVSKMEISLEKKCAEIDNSTAIEDVYEILLLLRNEFTNAEWDRVVEYKTKIFEFAHSEQNN